MPFDFAAVTAPFRMQPGLRRLAKGVPQLTPSKIDGRAWREKLVVLSQHADDALLKAPGFDAAAAWQALAGHAAAEHPVHWQDDGQDLAARWPAEARDALSALPPHWQLPARLALAFEEDFAIVDGHDAHIPALAVCLPSHWSPRDKVGRHFSAVHQPVADNALLVSAAAHLVRLVTGPERWERFVWTITTGQALDMHPDRGHKPPWPPDGGADALAALAWFRTERQTFIPLPSLQQAIFTIHVDSAPLVDAVATPEAAARVHDALATMSPAVLAYRGLAPAKERLLAWLAARR